MLVQSCVNTDTHTGTACNTRIFCVFVDFREVVLCIASSQRGINRMQGKNGHF